MFATLDSHVQLDSYKIHTPYFAGVFLDFLSTCDPRYVAPYGTPNPPELSILQSILLSVL